MSKRRVLFLCTGNSARSQMAEGLVNHFLGDRWEAHSAGTQPTGVAHPLAVQAMGDLGIDISAQRSKSTDEFRDADFDLVITVCDDAARNCPVWLGEGKTTHVGFPDPAAATGSEIERLEAFRQVRDGLHQKISATLERMEEGVEPGSEGRQGLDFQI
jgi:arsenate reductase